MEGFFLKEVTVYLPSELKSSAGRTSLSVKDLLIDDFGVSGFFSMKNVLPIDKGDASGWPFSINNISIQITQNKLSGGALAGAISIPFLGSDTLGYSAQVENTNAGLKYYFSVTTNTIKTYSMPFGGTIKLDKGCIVKMEAGNKKLIPSAILNGTLYLSNDLVKADGLKFERLHLTTESPYIL